MTCLVVFTLSHKQERDFQAITHGGPFTQSRNNFCIFTQSCKKKGPFTETRTPMGGFLGVLIFIGYVGRSPNFSGKNCIFGKKSVGPENVEEKTRLFWKKIVGGYQITPGTNFRHTFRKYLPDPPSGKPRKTQENLGKLGKTWENSRKLGETRET